MAAFDRAREALGGVPQLSPTMERVLYNCGENAGLVWESWLKQLCWSQPRLLIGAQLSQQQGEGKTLLYRPLLLALQANRAACGYCSPLGRLRIQSRSQSGSSIEGLMSPARVDDSSTVEGTIASDTDIMLQLGPVRWTAPGTHGECPEGTEGERAGGATAQGARDRSETSIPSLTAIPTENPGFVLLLQEKESGCTHQDRRYFTAESVRQLIYDYCTMLVDAGELTLTGPATSFHSVTLDRFERDGFDMVPCLRALWWPSDEFFKRQRTCDWPPASARDDIEDFGIHLVPVGAKGSETEREEWRLSFSRAEVVAARHLSPEQQLSIIMSKACKTALGPQ